MIHFKNFDFLQATKEEWNQFHSFRRDFHLENYPGEPLTANYSFEAFRKGRVLQQDTQFYQYGIFDSDKQIGFFSYEFFDKKSPSYADNKKIVFFDIKLLKDYRRQGIGSDALKMIADKCEKEDKSIFIVEYDMFESRKFLDTIGAKTTQIFSESKLIMDSVDIILLQSWIKEAKKLNKTTKLLIIEGKIPEEYIEEFVVTLTDSINNQPRDDSEIGDETITVSQYRKEVEIANESGHKVLTALTLEQNGKISSLTQIKIIPGKEKNLSQGITGVPVQYRGRKLAKWIKAGLLLYVKEKYPEVECIITGNADSNNAMLHINDAMGFKEFKKEFNDQISIETLQNYLKTKFTSELQTNSLNN